MMKQKTQVQNDFVRALQEWVSFANAQKYTDRTLCLDNLDWTGCEGIKLVGKTCSLVRIKDNLVREVVKEFRVLYTDPTFEEKVLYSYELTDSTASHMTICRSFADCDRSDMLKEIADYMQTYALSEVLTQEYNEGAELFVLQTERLCEDEAFLKKLFEGDVFADLFTEGIRQMMKDGENQ